MYGEEREVLPICVSGREAMGSDLLTLCLVVEASVKSSAEILENNSL